MISKIERKKLIEKIGALVVTGLFLAISFASPAAADQPWGEDDTWVIVDDPGPNTDGHIRWVEDDDEKMRLTDGNLGIGTASPGNKLTVQQDYHTISFGNGQIRIQGDTDPNQFLSFKLQTADNWAQIQAGDDSSGANLYYPLALNPFGGNVGIKTTSPQSMLHIYQGNAGADPIWHAGDIMILESDSHEALHFFTPDDQMSGIMMSSPSGRDIGGLIYDHYYDKMYLRTNSDNRIVIDSSGRVGIATEIPNTALHVLKEDDGANVDLITFDRATDSPADGDSYDIIFNHENDNDQQEDFAQITLIAEDVSDGTEAGTLVFSVADGVDGSMDEAMRIEAGGNVGIGTTSPQGALDVVSTTGGFIVPRMTTAQRNALTPVNGMIIYNTDTPAFNFYENGEWVTK